MNALLLRVGIDKGTDKALAPIFENGQFEYIPMSEKCASTEKFTYGNKPSKNSDCPLSTYLPKALENKIMHLDPEFDTPSYGDITSKRNYLLELEEDDLLVFYTGLTPFKNTIFKEALYLIGYFTVKEKIDFNKLSEVQMEEAYQRYKNNSHIKRLDYPQNLVIIVGKEKESNLLPKAILISKTSLDAKGRQIQVVSDEMVTLLGISGSIQRSIPPRFIKQREYLDNLRKILGLSLK